MMSLTHAAIALSGTSLILGTAEPLPLGLAVLGSQLPDIDTTTSTVGKIFFPISSWIEDRFPHRSITHSFLATAGLTFASVAVCYLLGNFNLINAIALPLGHLLACFSDTFTKQGVQLFYPNPAWAISVSNPRRRLKTGGAAELWVLGTAIALLTLGIYLANGGGITSKVSQNLGLRDGIVRIYKTNEQIIVEKLTTEIGEYSRTEIRNLTFNDEDAIAPLQQLQQAYPGADIFLNGELTVDFPEDVRIPIEPNQMATAVLSGNRIKFSYCGLSRAIALLKEQYAVGNVEVKILQAEPLLKVNYDISTISSRLNTNVNTNIY